MSALRRLVTLRKRSNNPPPPPAAQFLDSPSPGVVFSTEEERANIRGFIRKLLDAFVDASEVAHNRFNLSTYESARCVRKDGLDKFFRAPRSDLGDSVILDRMLRQLHSLHTSCIEYGVDCFARLLLAPESAKNLSRNGRIKAAMSQDISSSSPERSMSVPLLSELPEPPSITAEDAFRVLRTVTSKFKEQLEAETNETTPDNEWEPDWRCQAVVWSLITSLGSIAPPSVVSTPYQELKEAAFACLFERDFIDNQWEKCTFSNSLLRFIPRPNNWDSDLSWVGVSFFVALPLAGMVSEVTKDEFPFRRGLSLNPKGIRANGTRNGTSTGIRNGTSIRPNFTLRKPGDHGYSSFWVLTFTFFIFTAIGMMLYYAFYRSQYSKKLMRKAALGTAFADKFQCATPETGPLHRTQSVFGMSKALDDRTKSDSESMDDAVDRATELDTVVTDNGLVNVPSAAPSPSTRHPASSAPVLPTSGLDSNISGTGNRDNTDGISDAEAGVTAEGGGGTNRELFPEVQEPAPPSPIAPTISVTKSQARGLQAFFDDESFEPTKQNRTHTMLSPARAVGFADKDELVQQANTSTLRLYQASMYVERIYGSKYFDESWVFGLSEKSLYDAMRMTLSTDSTLGRQYAAFSFAAIAVSSRGAPLDSSLEAIASFNFGIFAFLACLTFVCGLTSAVLADQILRQMTFSDISRDGTAHLFANRFGFFIRVVGSLNSLAGMFLSTAILHFLLRIFKVNAYCVILLATVWLVTGSVSFSCRSIYIFSLSEGYSTNLELRCVYCRW